MSAEGSRIDNFTRKKRKASSNVFTFAHVGARRYAINVTYDIVNKECVVTDISVIVNQMYYPFKQMLDNVGEPVLKAKLKRELGRFTGLMVSDFSLASFVK